MNYIGPQFSKQCKDLKETFDVGDNCYVAAEGGERMCFNLMVFQKRREAAWHALLRRGFGGQTEGDRSFELFRQTGGNIENVPLRASPRRFCDQKQHLVFSHIYAIILSLYDARS